MRINFKWQGILRYQKLSEDAQVFMPSYKGDAGYDICSIEDKIVKAKGSTIVRTGVALEIPEEYFGILRTRSGYGIKNSLQIHHGLIDSGYRGEITIKIYNHSDQDYQVKKKDKICQLILLPRIVLPLKQEKILMISDRGNKGFGSTGK